MADPKKQLREFINQQRKAKEQAEQERVQRNDADRNAVLQGVGQDLADALKPVLEELPKSAQITEQQIKNALTEAIQVSMPEVSIPEINIPEIKIDTKGLEKAVQNAIKGLKIDSPQVNIPESTFELPERFAVNIDQFDEKKPLPVRLYEANGKPFQIAFPAGASGGKADFLTIKGIQNSAWGELINADGRLRTENNTASSSITGTVTVDQLSGANWSVSVNDIFRTTVATNLINSDDRLRVSVETGGSGLTDSELRATAVPVSQLSGANWSTEVTNTVTVDGSGVTQPVSGTVTVSGITNTIAANVVDSGGVPYTTSNPLPIDDAGGSVTVDGTVTAELSATDNAVLDQIELNQDTQTAILNTIDADTGAIKTAVEILDNAISGSEMQVDVVSGTITAVTGITNSVAASIVDSSGVQYSGSNPLPIDIVQALDHTIDSISVRQVSGANYSTQSKLIARQTNPTAASDATEVFASADDLGRTLMRPIQVRDLIATAYTSLTSGTETTLLAGAASTFHDLIYVMCANQSDVATFVDFRCGTAGTVIMTVQVPAEGTAGVSLPVPHKMPEVAQAWTVDLPDITGTTVDITAQFSKEI
jgi:hypothetical protein